MVKNTLNFFSAEKFPKRLNLFSNVFYPIPGYFKFDFFFPDGEKSKSNIRSHRIQYSKILKSPHIFTC